MTDEIRIKRVDKLAASIQKRLREEHDIYDGLVKFNVVRDPAPRVVSVEQCTGLFSQLYSDARKEDLSG